MFYVVDFRLTIWLPNVIHLQIQTAQNAIRILGRKWDFPVDWKASKMHFKEHKSPSSVCL